jgi:alpha/beta superfamily hydrolase
MPEVFFSGPAGRIEGRYTQALDKKAPVALVLHPHPLYGGTMNNKVVYSAYKSFVDQGFTTLRINFRGVGRSQGVFDNGAGELTDAATAMDWLQLHNPFASSYFVSGFSFGSWICMQLIMRRPEINHFIAISPPVNKYDFSFLSPCPIPGLVVQGDKDSIVSEDAVVELVERLSKQKHSDVEYKTIHGGDHFFREKLGELEQALGEYIRERVSNQAPERSTKPEIARQKLLLD